MHLLSMFSINLQFCRHKKKCPSYLCVVLVYLYLNANCFDKMGWSGIVAFLGHIHMFCVNLDLPFTVKLKKNSYMRNLNCHYLHPSVAFYLIFAAKKGELIKFNK